VVWARRRNNKNRPSNEILHIWLVLWFFRAKFQTRIWCLAVNFEFIEFPQNFLVIFRSDAVAECESSRKTNAPAYFLPSNHWPRQCLSEAWWVSWATRQQRDPICIWPKGFFPYFLRFNLLF
jgi:hypothetical protein